MDLLKQKIFFKLRPPQGHPPQEGTPEFKKWRSAQKAPVEKWAEDKNRYTYTELADWPNVGMAIPQGYIVIDIDNKVQAAKVHKAILEYGINCIISNTGNGKHFIFKDPKGNNRLTQSNGQIAVGGLKIDSRIPAYENKNGGYIAVKFLPDAELLGKSNGERFVSMSNLNELDEIPFWLEPIKQQWSDKAKEVVSLEWNEGSRDDGLRAWTTILWKTDTTKKKELMKAISFINDYLMDVPVLRGHQLVSKVEGWIKWAEENKVDRVVNIGSEEQHFGAFGLVETPKDINYVELAKHLKELMKIKFYASKWWQKKDKPWYEEINDEDIYREFIDKAQNVALKADEKKFFTALRSICFTQENKEDKKYINFLNGRFNLEKKELESYTDEDVFINFGIGHNYNPEAIEPYLDIAFNRWTQNHKDEKKALLEFVGYTMYSVNPGWGKGLIIYGANAGNGKSTFLNLLMGIFNQNKDITSLNLKSLESRFGAYDLIGKRLMAVPELEDVYIEQSPVLKQMITGDLLTVEGKNLRNKFSFHPNNKFIGLTNKFPRFGDHTNGVWRRFTILPFDYLPTLEEQQEFESTGLKRLNSQAAKERLIYLGVQHLIELLKRTEFIKPERSKQIKKQFRIESYSISAWAYADDALSFESVKIGSSLSENFEAYKHWCKNNNYKAVGRNKFKRELELMVDELYWEQKGKQSAMLRTHKKKEEMIETSIDELLN